MIKYSYYGDVPDNFTGVCELTAWEAICHLKEGLLHRTDGPAVEWTNGNVDWYIDGKEFSKEDFDSLPEVIMHREGLEIFT